MPGFSSSLFLSLVSLVPFYEFVWRAFGVQPALEVAIPAPTAVFASPATLGLVCGGRYQFLFCLSFRGCPEGQPLFFFFHGTVFFFIFFPHQSFTVNFVCFFGEHARISMLMHCFSDPS